MAELNAGILSEGLASSVRSRKEKIPVELRMADGSVRHPSGFELPTAETDFHPVAAKTPTDDIVHGQADVGRAQVCNVVCSPSRLHNLVPYQSRANADHHTSILR
ncbi:hypothetical protein SCP_1500580 [Sparassis crispa]|uniref:Uncharacterized protein n=1 Tax=Sparassis crispa TaxID=139825 RepID=A0A401H3N4_9APHY|nr:hypothetical protein SCP_1500580 [Sparassis crispa]GBE89056.1 hypothetical protein SCP_1500580 [Sparassis crispa]